MNNANIEDYKSNELDQPIKTDNGFGQTDKKKNTLITIQSIVSVHRMSCKYPLDKI